jgi:hypothetical protein
MLLCEDCINREICVRKNPKDCEHYDVPLTRGEILEILSDVKTKDPAFIPQILGAIKRTYHINLAY